MADQLEGSCLCGDVRFSARGQINRVSACYCSQCRKQNGGGPFYGVEMQGELRVEDDSTLQWFASSAKAMRAFCSRCGSSLFWRLNDKPSVFDVSLGVLSDDQQLSLDAHIFVDSCPSYVVIPDTAPHLREADM